MSRIAVFAVTFVVCLALAAPHPAAAQGVGQISGRVTDPSDAVIPGADVMVSNTGTGVSQNFQTGAQGYYTALSLPPGNYRVEVRAEGFRGVSRGGVKLDTDQSLRLDFQLEVGK